MQSHLRPNTVVRVPAPLLNHHRPEQAAEVEETVATPYMGFNLGVTKYRQSWTGDIEPNIFESGPSSPVVEVG